MKLKKIQGHHRKGGTFLSGWYPVRWDMFCKLHHKLLDHLQCNHYHHRFLHHDKGICSPPGFARHGWAGFGQSEWSLRQGVLINNFKSAVQSYSLGDLCQQDHENWGCWRRAGTPEVWGGYINIHIPSETINRKSVIMFQRFIWKADAQVL